MLTNQSCEKTEKIEANVVKNRSMGVDGACTAEPDKDVREGRRTTWDRKGMRFMSFWKHKKKSCLNAENLSTKREVERG